ncbi:MAG: hypothetical protein IT373_01115 [Polyangiaceae bacterium]|nr:hypothetical protein [Polyangiaceae bacterium]
MRRSRAGRRGALLVAVLVALVSPLGAARLMVGCSGWEPSRPFERDSPVVERALAELDAGKYASAAELLESYLGTGPCSNAKLGLPAEVRKKWAGSFDLGLTLFYVAEQYGQRFGDEEERSEGPEQRQKDGERASEVECAQIVTKAIAADDKVPLELRARAFYLSGNLEFLRRRYEDAVRQYDRALELVPGVAEDAGSDGIGRDAAWNRAIALRRIHERDAGADADADSPPDAPDAAPDAGDDAGDAGEPDGGDDAGDDGGPDAGQDGGDDGGGDAGDGADGGDDGGADNAGPDAGKDGGSEKPDAGGDPDDSETPQEEEPQPGQEPQGSRGQQLDRILDELEESPSYQQEQAKRENAGRRRVMEDK